MLKKMLLLICIVLSLTFITACSNGISGEKIGIRGQITNITLDDDGKIKQILVEGKIESDTQHDKASISILENTQVYKGNPVEKISISDLKEGQRVEVVFQGPVRESYPVQADARYIRVID